MALTPAQQATLAAHIAASSDMNTLPPGSTSALAIADLLNAPAAPQFVVWKSSVRKDEVGKAFQASALAAITAGNNDKLANFAAWNDTIYPSRADQRAFFDDVFSVSAGATTRANLLALWKRTATRGEKVFATGTGSDASPATLNYEGAISYNDVKDAMGW
jgi:hypothetical protein